MRWSRRTRTEQELDYVFVMTYGRSGSTLLLGILNSIDGWLLRGENRHALRHFYDFHRSCVAERDRVDPEKASTSVHPWFGIQDFDEQVSLAGIRRLVSDTLLRPEPGTTVSGYKEIRWYDEDLAEYVHFLRQVFPGARFVINTRDHAEVQESAFWRHEEDAAARLREIEDRMLAVAADLGDAAFRVHYNDFKDDPGALRPLFDWLEEPWDEERVRATLATRHSFRGRPRAAKQR